jgi:hypothetical protein
MGPPEYEAGVLSTGIIIIIIIIIMLYGLDLVTCSNSDLLLSYE